MLLNKIQKQNLVIVMMQLKLYNDLSFAMDIKEYIEINS